MKHVVKRSSLFLTELVLSLLIFIVCAVVSVSLLVVSYSTSRQSTDLTQAVFLAESMAEDWKAYALSADGEPIAQYFDENWQPTGHDNATFLVVLGQTAPKDQMETANISVHKGEDHLYVLSVNRLKEGVLYE